MSRSWFTLAAAAALLAACQKKPAQTSEGQAGAARDTFSGKTVTGFSTPESILLDPAADVYLVDNINGAPTAKDNNGFISKVSPDGQVLALKWIEGGQHGVTLHAPKGSGLHGDTLFVADIDNVRLFSRTDGHHLADWPVPGSTFLNDICVGPDGTVYVTDTGVKADFSSSGTAAVYRFERGRPVAMARGEALDKPNGCAADSTGIVVVGFGTGKVYRLDRSGRRTDLRPAPAGQLDGVFFVHDTLVLSSWADSSVWRLAPHDTAYTLVARGLQSPADIAFDAGRHRLLVPQFQKDQIQILPLR